VTGSSRFALWGKSHSSHAAVWVLTVGIAGLITSALFSSVLHLSRNTFVAAHALVTLVLVKSYVAFTHTDPAAEARRRWRRGLVTGLVLGMVLVRGVTMQPSSTVASGGGLVTGIVWFGLIYGMVDAVLLSVIPVHAFTESASDGRAGAGRKALRAAWAMAASLLVTALYHLGFAEFRGPALLQPLIGNAIVTAGYLASRNPLTPIASHVIMHVAAVVHGMESTTQLPPHY
jgi:hypothetical protein